MATKKAPAPTKKAPPTEDHHSNLKNFLNVLAGVVGALAVITPVIAAPYVDEEDAAKIKSGTDAAKLLLGSLQK